MLNTVYSSCLAAVFISVAKREEKEQQPSNTSAPHLSTMNISSAIQLRTIDVGEEVVWYNRDEVRNLRLYVFIHFFNIPILKKYIKMYKRESVSSALRDITWHVPIKPLQ